MNKKDKEKLNQLYKGLNHLRLSFNPVISPNGERLSSPEGDLDVGLRKVRNWIRFHWDWFLKEMED